MILRTVTGIDVAVRAVLNGERRIPDDRLVIATGARESYFGHNEWAAVMSGLKTIEDVTPMRRPILIAFELAWLVWGVAHIYFLIGFRNRMAVAIDWLWSYGPYEDPLIIDIRPPAGQLAG